MNEELSMHQAATSRSSSASRWSAHLHGWGNLASAAQRRDQDILKTFSGRLAAIGARVLVMVVVVPK
jgi:hypothetical protein